MAGVVAQTTSVLVVSSLPLFLIGGVAAQLRADLAFSAAGLGLAVSLFRVSQAVGGIYLGALTDRIGAGWASRAAAATSAVVCFGIALTARSWGVLMAWTVVGGLGKALAQPAANRQIVHHIPVHRQGIAVGFKQTAAPLSTLLAGAAVPLLVTRAGWRSAFVATGIMGFVLLLALVPTRAGSVRTMAPRSASPPLRNKPVLRLLALSFGFATVAGTAVPTYWVDYFVESGATPALAGTLLAVASAGAIVTRLVSGIACDRVHRHLRICAGLLIMGSLGLGLIGTGLPLWAGLGVFMAQSGAWGYSAVLWYAVLRAFSESPGKVTGLLAIGGLSGGAIGPLILGVLASAGGYRISWYVAAAASLVAAGTLMRAERALMAIEEESL